MKDATIALLKRLGLDLIASIENANWKGRLERPTPHMNTAIENFKDALYERCEKCGTIVGDKRG